MSGRRRRGAPSWAPPWARRAATVALTAALLAGCGVATSGTADRARSDDVPFDLLAESPDTGTGARSASGVSADLYYYDSASTRLRRVNVTLDEGDLQTVLMQLQVAPTGRFPQVPAGNPLGDAEVIQSVELSRGLATVDLNESFSDISGPNQLIALAEIVYTATGRPGVGQVVFTLEGEPVDVPRGDGSLSSQPVTRSDYANVAPEG